MTPKKTFKPFIIPLLLIISGIAIYSILMATRPTANKLPRKQEDYLVEVFPIHSTNETTKIFATGTIRPAIQIPLQSRVTGEIIKVSENFVPGGIFKKDEIIIQIDPTDFKITLTQRQSELATANANLKLELGNQSIAKAEYKLLEETLNPDDLSLVLRQPQIEIVK